MVWTVTPNGQNKEAVVSNGKARKKDHWGLMGRLVFHLQGDKMLLSAIVCDCGVKMALQHAIVDEIVKQFQIMWGHKPRHFVVCIT